MSIFPPPPLHNKTKTMFPDSIEHMRTILYNSHQFTGLLPSQYTGEITPNIENLLDQMYKLTKLFKQSQQYESDTKIVFVQPYFDQKQQFRCYLSDSYIVVEINESPDKGFKWKHIIENHNADDKNGPRYYIFSAIPGLNDDDFGKISDAVACVVETVETHIFNLMQGTKTIFEKVKMIRIGDKSDEELKKEAEIQAWANLEVLKKEKALNVAAKANKRKEFWNKIFGEAKIKFS